MYTYQEYLILMGSIAGLAIVALVARNRSKKKQEKTQQWNDLNQMFTDLYNANDSLKQDLHYSAAKVKIMSSVQDTLKLSAETMYEVNTNLMETLEKTVRACDALQQEILYLKGELKNVEENPGDDLDDWYQIQTSDPNQIHLFENE